MKTKELIAKTLTRNDLAQMKRLTTSNIAFSILKIMQKHIGNDNAITRGQLFKRIFGRTEEITLADELRWDYVKKAMHLCRQRTKCFIGSKYERGLWRYFVIENMNDAEYYIMTLHKNIKRMEAMQKKAVQSVKQGWSQLNWVDEVNDTKALGYTGKLNEL